VEDEVDAGKGCEQRVGQGGEAVGVVGISDQADASDDPLRRETPVAKLRESHHGTS
jgi:hypothetical protein